jgi:acetyltransferase-like isoleucine patch superfamily enzyme
MKLIERIRKEGVSPKHVGYLARLLALKLRYGQRVAWQSLTISFQKTARLSIEGDGRVRFGSWAHLKRGCDIDVYPGASVTIGDRFFMNKNSSIVSRYGVEIGSDCLIGDHVSIYDHNHEFRRQGAAARKHRYFGRPIRIGNNVWLGSKVFVGAGVTIGDNAVVGANSVIVKDVPANTVVYNRVALVCKPIPGSTPEASAAPITGDGA